MARPEIDPSLQLRNQESVRLTDTELANINAALEIFNTRNGFKISRSTFLKSNALAEVTRILASQGIPSDVAPTSPEAKATTRKAKATTRKARATTPKAKATKATKAPKVKAVKKTKKRGSK